ncbi:MAG: hypothetical protein WCG01_02685 [bacterium]
MFNRISSFGLYVILTSALIISSLLCGSYLGQHPHPLLILILPVFIFFLILIIHNYKIYSKIALFFLPIILGVVNMIAIEFSATRLNNFNSITLFYAIVGGAIMGLILSLNYLYFFDKPILTDDIKYKPLLILGLIIPLASYGLRFSYVNTYQKEDVMLYLNCGSIFLALLFIFLNRKINDSWGWKILALFGIVFSIFVTNGVLSGLQYGYGDYDYTQNELPLCSSSITNNCHPGLSEDRYDLR